MESENSGKWIVSRENSGKWIVSRENDFQFLDGSMSRIIRIENDCNISSATIDYDWIINKIIERSGSIPDDVRIVLEELDGEQKEKSNGK